MRIKKYAAAFLAATTVLGSLAACGGDDKAKDTAKDVTNPVSQDGSGTGTGYATSRVCGMCR